MNLVKRYVINVYHMGGRSKLFVVYSCSALQIEVELYCDLTARQRALYRGLKEKLSISELLEKATSLSDSDSLDSLMNLVMQFRKVRTVVLLSPSHPTPVV
jgi:SNF2 family DNA or RNA helicase